MLIPYIPYIVSSFFLGGLKKMGTFFGAGNNILRYDVSRFLERDYSGEPPDREWRAGVQG